ncbi:uncharacterized protein yc1106_01849 [Curvularia clavata]|uniref:UBA domain-containing protein n=1 Tax=Curvularia clavata TaxID=95742 RepID=A0A9Q9DPY8_CURCL|nr:uncharacterized protein yc1106_01849 [Curvularia clavata]
MARIVQDSDDELDEDLEAELPISQQPRASSQRPGCHNPQSTGGIGRTDMFLQPSSAVTLTVAPDPLSRPSDEGYSVHLQPRPSQNELQSSVSLPESEHPNKRRKTEPHLSPGQPLLGISAKGDDSAAYGNSAGFNHNSPSMHNSLAHFPPVEIAAGYDLVSLPEVPWNLEGTMRNDYAQHDPSMFGEPSSTVPNATMTQQRVLEVVKAPIMLGQESGTGGPCYQPPPDPSPPWSDLMKFTPAGTNEQAESSAREPPPGTSSGTPLLTMQKDLGLPASSLHLERSPLKNNWDHTERDHVDSEPVASKNDPQTMSKASLAARSECHSNEQMGAKASSFRQHSQPPPSSDDELTAIGLPEEQYKPRPSRSRSLKVDTEEPIDYSIRPEKAMKVSKRRRTTAEMRAANSITTPEKVRQICDMGFTPSTTAGALKRNNGDVIQTVDWLVTNNIGHDELAPQSPPRPMPKQRKGNELPAVDAQAVQDIMRGLNEYHRDDDKIAQSARSVVPDTDSITVQPITTTSELDLPSESAQNVSPTKVQVVIPKKSPKPAAKKVDDATSASSKKTKRQKTASDQPGAESSQTTAKAPEVVTEKKRGRGRPKKTAKTNETLEPIKTSEQDAKAEQPSELPKTIESNLATEKVDLDSEVVLEKAEPVEPIEPVEPVSSEHTNEPDLPSKPLPATASDTPEKLAKSTTASPMTKGKVPYRVGLSKRARIAPLLRTLKK